MAEMWRRCGGSVAEVWRWCGGCVAVVWRLCGGSVAVGHCSLTFWAQKNVVEKTCNINLLRWV